MASNSLIHQLFTKIAILAVFHTVININCTAQTDSVDNPADYDTVDNSLNVWKLSLIGSATVGGFVAGHGLLNTLWWKGERVDFHLNSSQDYLYALNADKLGHLCFSFSTATTYADMFRWSGMDSTAATWGGLGISLAYQTYIEIRDGYSKDYGFSVGDAIANTAGASLTVLKHYYPALRSFDLQISFWPSNDFKNGAYRAIIDDYSSTTHWLSFSVYDVLSAKTQEWYPPWLGLAVGHSVSNIDGKGAGQHQLFLSLDWNLQRISGLPQWARSLLRTLHLYHLPAPAVRILPSVVWYGLRF